MTNPGNVGDVYGKLHIDTDEVANDVRRGLNEAGREGDETAERIGRDHGELYAKGFRERSTTHMNQLSQELGNVLVDIQKQFSGIGFTAQDEAKARRGSRNFVNRIWDTISEVFTSRGRGFSKTFGNLFTEIIGGPIGALFNVSARSPLIILLIPLLGIIISLITAAVYGLQAFVSLLFLIPSLLFAIGLQGAALFLIFGGLGETIGAALSATNAQELEEALKGVNSEVADFIRQLIPWRDFIRELRDSAQLAFFGNLDAEGIGRVLANIRGPFARAITDISAALAGVANNLLDVFSSKSFATLIDVLGDSTVQWLQGFGPALANFIDGLNKFAIAIDPFLDWFGERFNNMISGWGDKLKELADDPEFMQWIEDSKVIMGDFIELLGEIWRGVKEFVAQFIAADKEMREAHGKGFLDVLSELTSFFVDFLASPIGKEAVKGFISILLILSAAFYAVAISILATLAAIQKLIDLFEWVWQKIFGPFNPEELDKKGKAIEDWGVDVSGIFARVGTAITAAFLRTFKIDQVLGIVVGIKHWLTGFFSDSGEWLRDAGTNIIKGVANGIRAGIGLSLVPALVTAAATVKKYFPFSPAEAGPLSGHGDPMNAGREIIGRVAAGIQMESPALTKAVNSATSNVNFGQGAVQVIYQGGTPPTQQQAQMMGKAAGQGITNQLTAVRLAVRTI